MNPREEDRLEAARARLISTAFSFLRRRQPEVARQLVHQLLEGNPNDPDGLAVLALVELAQGRSGEAFDIAAQAVGHGPTLPLPLTIFIQASLGCGRVESAHQAARALMVTQPESAASFGLAGTVAIELGRFDEAVRLAEAGIRIDPTSAMCRGTLGLARSLSGDHRAAISSLRESVRSNPTSADARTNLGFVVGATGDWDRASTYFGEAVALDPRNTVAVRNFEDTPTRQADPVVDFLGVRMFWRFAPLWQRLMSVIVLAASATLWLPAVPALVWSVASWVVEMRTRRLLTPSARRHRLIPLALGVAAVGGLLLLAEFPQNLGLAGMGLANMVLLLAALSIRNSRRRTLTVGLALALAAIPAIAAVVRPEVRGDVSIGFVWFTVMGLTTYVPRWFAHEAVEATRTALNP